MSSIVCDTPTMIEPLYTVELAVGAGPFVA
jgi:hypothetical protein